MTSLLWLRYILIRSLLILIVLETFVLSWNLWIDPLWLHTNEHSWNNRQYGFDERKQKMNRLIHTEKAYDSIIIGSSRSTFIDPEDFESLNVFNFSASSMQPQEYKGYIAAAQNKLGESLKTVYLGVDFQSTNMDRESQYPSPELYEKNARSYLWTLRDLLSLDTVEVSNKVARSSLSDQNQFPGIRYYNRNGVAFPKPVNKRMRAEYIEEAENSIKNDRYEYDTSIRSLYVELKEAFPGIQFVVFTTPVSSVRLDMLSGSTAYQNGFENWMKDLVDIFGEVHHFMNKNSITEDPNSFYDSQHMYPSVASKLTNALQYPERVTDDFGVVVNKSNLSYFLKIQ
ncbi:hypothetical protein ACFFIX_12815 [Metabacillus herbersteinensis]|uniref:Uncharacterized protein n=1 Tax=Metabacillus herbersteinensis TaxID=283816 RepID=A0ABV6GF57_9BACI